MKLTVMTFATLIGVMTMSYVDGRLYSCDRCREKVFCFRTGTKEMDGGYTEWDTFEKLPEGWKTYYDGIGLLCPECSAEYSDMQAVFKRRGKKFVPTRLNVKGAMPKDE